MNVLQLENVRIGFRNFEGREGKYNKAGERSFAVFLDMNTATDLAQQGWNVKFPKTIDVDPEEDSREPYLQVSVTMDKFPANIHIISNGNPTKLSGDEVGMLDWAELQNVDLVIRPYEWSVNGSSGIKAYLKSGYFVLDTDQFSSKYGI